MGPIPPVDRRVRAVHLLSLVAAGGLLLYDSTKLWFYLDEWDFLVNRSVKLSGSTGILYPHNEHWTTIPILIWRALFALVGIRHYWLYALPLVCASLLATHLLWRIMLRHEVEPWVATILCGSFLVLGAGSQDLFQAFQITFVGSLAFGLLAVEGVENDRLWLAAAWGICAVMCSNLGLPIVMACGLVALVRRRIVTAITVTLVPTIVFAAWWMTIASRATVAHLGLGYLLSGAPGYVWTGLTASAAGFFDLPRFVGVGLVIVLAAGALYRRNALAALAVTSVLVYGAIALGRGQEGYGHESGVQGRYMYLAIALLIPLAGQLLTALVRLPKVRTVVLVGLSACVALNVVVLQRAVHKESSLVHPAHAQVLAAARLIRRGEHFPDQAATYYEPGIRLQEQLTVGTLTRLVREGKLPVPSAKPGDGQVLSAERTIMGVFASRTPAYPGRLSFSKSKNPLDCVVVVNAGPSGSIPVQIRRAPSFPAQDPAEFIVAFFGFRVLPVLVTFSPGDQWLNFPVTGDRVAWLIKTDLDPRPALTYSVCRPSARQ